MESTTGMTGGATTPLETQKANIQACIDAIVANNDNDATVAGLEILNKLI